MKRILHVIHGLNVGGAETFIYNILRNIDSSEYHFDFAIQNPESDIRHSKAYRGKRRKNIHNNGL